MSLPRIQLHLHFQDRNGESLQEKYCSLNPQHKILMKLVNNCVSQSIKHKTRHRLEAVPRILRIMMLIRNFFCHIQSCQILFVFVHRVWDKINSDVTLYQFGDFESKPLISLRSKGIIMTLKSYPGNRLETGTEMNNASSQHVQEITTEHSGHC